MPAIKILFDFQIGVEFHFFADEYGMKDHYYRDILRLARDLGSLGFRLAAYEPNTCQEKKREVDKMYHNLFDVLLVRK